MIKKLSLLTLVLVLLAGCETKKFYETNVNSKTLNYVIKPNQWQESNDGGIYYYCQIKESALTNEVMNYGIYTAYINLLIGGVEVFSPLPFDDFFENTNNHRWTEQVTCEFSPGYITFILKYNDFEPAWPQDNYYFQVKLMW